MGIGNTKNGSATGQKRIAVKRLRLLGESCRLARNDVQAAAFYLDSAELFKISMISIDKVFFSLI